MLIEFSVTNFRSIRHTQYLSMLPSARVKSSAEDPRLIVCDKYPDTRTLSSAVIYGANASGKSNLLRAMELLKIMVEEGHNTTLGQGMEKYCPFCLSPEGEKLPTTLCISFVAHDQLLYEYSLSFSKKEILLESLYFYPKNRKVRLFERKAGHPILFGKFLKGNKKSIEEHTLPNQLFLSKAANNNLEQLKEVYLFFRSHLHTYILHKSLFNEGLIGGIAQYLTEAPDSLFAQNLSALVSHTDTGISKVVGQKLSVEGPHLFGAKDYYRIKTLHPVVDEEGEPIGSRLFDLEEESVGTRQLISLGGLIMRVLESGDVLVIDEMDKSMHTQLTRTLVKLFHNPETNPNKAQLIFATHDVSLLGKHLFRYDQVNLSEKMADGATEISVVSDITHLKRDFPIIEWYLSGKFGGTPMINDVEMELNFKRKKPEPEK